MQPQPYTLATIAFIRKEAETGRNMLAIADMLGWTVVWLRSVCRHHGVTFSEPDDVSDAKPDVGRRKGPGPQAGEMPARINRFSIDETIAVRVPLHIRELLQREADQEGIPLSRYAGIIIAKAIEAEGQR